MRVNENFSYGCLYLYWLITYVDSINVIGVDIHTAGSSADLQKLHREARKEVIISGLMEVYCFDKEIGHSSFIKELVLEKLKREKYYKGK